MFIESVPFVLMLVSVGLTLPHPPLGVETEELLFPVGCSVVGGSVVAGSSKAVM